MTCGFDPVLDEGLLYGEKLRQAGVPVIHRHYPTQLHGFTFLGGSMPDGPEALDFAGQCLREALYRLNSPAEAAASQPEPDRSVAWTERGT